ncbi:bifunctional 2-polyprenyl-6-hydroxyphenol methylase/3-demethylubiquinol 3-O-methyltransferase UbiG [Brevibacterium luteolum]|uniref:class I SAM-dependent methyltransferase n=1 Tax=Brevibacterium luteolum TaxID=199591 RepID=UPI001C215880|nr:class I SAM-dependent methyltransferase [Brevibacterium luteolum]MBU8579877.1 class I SAM-dependent methyltransferase [Brevibacterium luteolum]
MDSTSAQPAAASPEWFDDNRRNWDDRAAVHVASGYGIQALIDDPQEIPDTLAPDLPYLGDLTGASVIHLQCHLGTDTIGLKRQGAGRVVGIDLSGESLRRARELAAQCSADIEYVESNVYDARAAVDGEFDVVFSTLGVLCWLPDVTAWAQVVASLLAPGGTFLIRDDHPFFMTIGDDVSAGLRVEQPYFQQAEPMTWEDDSSYVDAPEAEPIQNTRNHQWNHSLGEIITALLQAGLVIDTVEETQHSAWARWPELMIEDEHGYRLRDNPERLPLQFRITAHKP